MSRIHKTTFQVNIGLILTASTFVLIGLLFAYLAFANIGVAEKKVSLANINQERLKLSQWPSVEGFLDELDIRSVSYARSREPSGTDFWPEVRYHYTVNGQDFTGNTLRKELTTGDHPYFCSDPITGLNAAKSKLTRFLPANLPDVRQQLSPGQAVYIYHPGTTVAVYYDPEEPGDSMLDNNWRPLSWLEYYSEEVAGVVIGSILAVLMLTLSAVGFKNTFKQPA